MELKSRSFTSKEPQVADFLTKGINVSHSDAGTMFNHIIKFLQQ